MCHMSASVGSVCSASLLCLGNERKAKGNLEEHLGELKELKRKLKEIICLFLSPSLRLFAFV